MRYDRPPRREDSPIWELLQAAKQELPGLDWKHYTGHASAEVHPGSWVKLQPYKKGGGTRAEVTAWWSQQNTVERRHPTPHDAAVWVRGELTKQYEALGVALARPQASCPQDLTK